MGENQRPYEPFNDDELIDIKFARDEAAAQMNDVMIAEDTKYFTRVRHARAALDKERFLKAFATKNVFSKFQIRPKEYLLTFFSEVNFGQYLKIILQSICFSRFFSFLIF